MAKLLIHTQPTTLAQWHSLIQQATHDLAVDLDANLESYLIFLLMRFTSQSDFVQSILATEYLKHLHSLGCLKNQALQDVGDKCLLFAGLFPEHAQRRNVKVSYFVKLGQSAYAYLTDMQANQHNQLYPQLSRQFVTLMDVLQVTRELEYHIPSISLETAQCLYDDTGSQHALHIVQLYTRNNPH